MFLPVILLINCWRNTVHFLHSKLYHDIMSVREESMPACSTSGE